MWQWSACGQRGRIIEVALYCNGHSDKCKTSPTTSLECGLNFLITCSEIPVIVPCSWLYKPMHLHTRQYMDWEYLGGGGVLKPQPYIHSCFEAHSLSIESRSTAREWHLIFLSIVHHVCMVPYLHKKGSMDMALQLSQAAVLHCRFTVINLTMVLCTVYVPIIMWYFLQC